MTEVEVRAKVAKFFTAAHGDNLMKLIMNGKLDQQQLDVTEAAGKATNYDVQSMLYLLHIISAL